MSNIFQKPTHKEIIQIISKSKISLVIKICIALLLIDIFLHISNLEGYVQGLFTNIWQGLIISVFVYFAVERGLEQYYKIPTDKNEKTIKEIIHDISQKQVNEILIMDTSIQNYFEGTGDTFMWAIVDALKRKTKIKILLLHPDSLAAKQRNEDLKKKKDVNFEKDMRDGLTALYKTINDLRRILDKNWEEGMIQIKLFNSTPSMIFTMIGEMGYYSIIPAFEYNSLDARVSTIMNTDFGNYLRRKFDKLWSYDDGDGHRVMSFDDFFYCSITSKNFSRKSIGILWGGGDYDRFLPRYIILQPTFRDINQHDNTAFIERELFDNLYVTLTHNRRDYNVRATHKYDYTEEVANDYIGASEYKRALQKISKTYSWETSRMNDTSMRIYEIEYAREQYNIQFEKDEIAERLEAVGYSFLSHKGIDININDRFLQPWNLLVKQFENLPFDGDDEAACNERLDKNVVPRKRAMIIYEAIVRNGIIEITQYKSDNEYKGTFAYNEGSKQLHFCRDRKFKTPFELLKESNGNGLYDIKLLDGFFQSIIKVDLDNILPAHKKTKSEWKIYFHLIRFEVKNNERGIVVPEDKVVFSRKQYQIVHLINMFNIADGITNVFDLSDNTIPINKFYLQKPLDSIFINREKVKIQVSDIRFKAWRRNRKNQKGYRDSIVIEFEQTKN